MGIVMKSAAPEPADILVDQRSYPGKHGIGGLVGKGGKQYPFRFHAAFYQAGHAVGKGAGLAAAGAGNHKERPTLLHNYLKLLIIEVFLVINQIPILLTPKVVTKIVTT